MRGDEAALRRALRAARRASVPARRLDEALLQVIPFGGFARAINAFWVLREMDPRPAVPAPRLRGLRRRGSILCRRIYGPAYERMLRRMRDLHPLLAEWILEDGYGKVLSRPALSPRERELLVVPMLVALGLKRQIPSHVRGAVRVGATAEQLEAVLKGCGLRYAVRVSLRE